MLEVLPSGNGGGTFKSVPFSFTKTFDVLIPEGASVHVHQGQLLDE